MTRGCAGQGIKEGRGGACMKKDKKTKKKKKKKEKRYPVY